MLVSVHSKENRTGTLEQAQKKCVEMATKTMREKELECGSKKPREENHRTLAHLAIRKLMKSNHCHQDEWTQQHNNKDLTNLSETSIIATNYK